MRKKLNNRSRIFPRKCHYHFSQLAWVLTRTPQIICKGKERLYVRFASIQCLFKELLRQTERFISVLRGSEK
ncbi:hypothetical protein V6Z11_D07G182700 [Gossypium hirsutum]